MRYSVIGLRKILIISTFLTFNIFGQLDSLYHKSIRLEIGAGVGFSHNNADLSARAAFSYIGTDFGMIVRATVNSGNQGIVLSHDWLTIGPPLEKFYEFGFLGSLVVYQATSFQVLTNVGLGILHGEKLIKSKTELEGFKNEKGFAFEIAFASAGSSLGYIVNFLGDINSVTNIYAITLSVSIGYQK